MGIVNVTPDSFSDGGLYAEVDTAVEHARRLFQEGADILDVGGESTRPGADPVSAKREIERVVPVIRGIVEHCPDAIISIDTSKEIVAKAAIGAGARVVNDVTALDDPEMAATCAAAGVDIVLMHMRGEPRTMQTNTRYGDLLQEVAQYLSQRIDYAIGQGVVRTKIVVDPGVGFGKSLDDNPKLISGLSFLRTLGVPVLVGASRKRFIGRLTGQDNAADRVFGSVGAALAAAQFGADILRVHDVAATRQALAVFLACQHTESRP
jgi:dihydropteroate synthase